MKIYVIAEAGLKSRGEIRCERHAVPFFRGFFLFYFFVFHKTRQRARRSKVTTDVVQNNALGLRGSDPRTRTAVCSAKLQDLDELFARSSCAKKMTSSNRKVERAGGISVEDEINPVSCNRADACSFGDTLYV